MDAFIVLFQQTLVFTIPLLLVALGGMISEKSGITNVGLEGMMIMGAAAGIGFIHTFEGKWSGQLFFIVAILIAALVGGILSLVHGYAAITIGANQTISGTALNLFAPAFVIFMAEALLGERKVNFVDSFVVDSVPGLVSIPFIGPVFFKNSYLTTIIALAILCIVIFVLSKTKTGLRLGACGEHPQAAASVGINVKKYRYIAVFISGMLSGIGGIAFVIPTSTSFNGTVSGYGFLALALVIFGKWKPLNIFAGAAFFGFLKALSSVYSSLPFFGDIQLPAEFYRLMPYLVTLIVLTISSKKSEAPKALGIPYAGEGE